MTLRTRNLVLHIALLLSMLFFAAAAFSAIMLLREEALPDLLQNIERAQSWFGLEIPMDTFRVLLSLGAALIAPLLAILGLGVVERFFRRTLSPQVFFFAMFLLGLSFEAGRAGQAYLYFVGVPYAVLATVTRFVAFGRVIAMSSLVASSLYAAGISYQKNGIVLAIILAVSGGVAYASPVNTLILAPDLLFRLGEGYSIDVVHLLLGLVAVVNYLQAAWAEDRREYLAHALAVFALVVGWLMLIELPMVSPLAVGVVLMIIGTALFLKRRYTSYLWS